MNIQQFAENLDQEADRSPLLEALQALRACDLDQIRSPKEGLQAGWGVWDEDRVAPTPMRVARPSASPKRS